MGRHGSSKNRAGKPALLDQGGSWGVIGAGSWALTESTRVSHPARGRGREDDGGYTGGISVPRWLASFPALLFRITTWRKRTRQQQKEKPPSKMIFSSASNHFRRIKISTPFFTHRPAKKCTVHPKNEQGSQAKLPSLHCPPYLTAPFLDFNFLFCRILIPLFFPILVY